LRALSATAACNSRAGAHKRLCTQTHTAAELAGAGTHAGAAYLFQGLRLPLRRLKVFDLACCMRGLERFSARQQRMRARRSQNGN